MSAFAWKGKWKALKLLLKNKSYVTAMMELGEPWQLSDETFNGIKLFVCHLYGKKYQNVDFLCYELHCAKGALRANYQAAIWRRAIFPQPEIPSPHDHRWKINNDNEITIVWLGTKPAPDEVL